MDEWSSIEARTIELDPRPIFSQRRHLLSDHLSCVRTAAPRKPTSLQCSCFAVLALLSKITYRIRFLKSFQGLYLFFLSFLFFLFFYFDSNLAPRPTLVLHYSLPHPLCEFIPGRPNSRRLADMSRNEYESYAEREYQMDDIRGGMSVSVSLIRDAPSRACIRI